MKRRWQIGWILFASLLITLAAWLFVAWPKEPRWQLSHVLPLGFDLNQRLLWTLSNTQEEEHELIGYDLASGRKRLAYPIPFDPSQTRSTKFFHGILSADSKFLACYDNVFSIQTFDLQNQCQRIGTIPVNNRLYSFAISANGDSLALYMSEKQVDIRDARTGDLKQSLYIPASYLLSSRGNFCQPKLMQFSSDGKYLAVAHMYHENIQVFDINTGQIVGICEKSKYPLFPSNNVLIAIPNLNTADRSQQWYQIDKGTIKQLPLSHHFDSKDDLRGIACNSNYAYYFKWVDTTLHVLPKWIPSSLRHKLEVALGKYTIHYDVLIVCANTGKLLQEFPLRIQKHDPHLAYYDTMISPDGSLLVFMEENSVSLWNIPPRRSLNCWLVCIAITLVALWLAWPRRVKPQPATTK